LDRHKHALDVRLLLRGHRHHTALARALVCGYTALARAPRVRLQPAIGERDEVVRRV
jgi:hypothetical protein